MRQAQTAKPMSNIDSKHVDGSKGYYDGRYEWDSALGYCVRYPVVGTGKYEENKESSLRASRWIEAALSCYLQGTRGLEFQVFSRRFSFSLTWSFLLHPGKVMLDY